MKRLVIGISLLLLLGIVILHSVAPTIFPLYFLYLILAIACFIVFSQIEYEILSLFSWHFYILSILFLILPLLVGQITRGAVRWIPLGPLTIQPAEIVRPFLLIFFANFLTQKEISLKRISFAVLFLSLPIILILVQPSLGVAILTLVGFVGILLSLGFNKKIFLPILLFGIIFIPVVWQLLVPYQKARLISFFSPSKDPLRGGYNSLQSMISVGSGRLWGRGLGEGVQTQLAFLPERHTDFIFASVAEEMGFVGAILLLLAFFFVLYQILLLISSTRSLSARAFVSGVFLILFVQTIVHIGMNMALFPITGIPLPLVSAGGSSLLGTMILLGMVISTVK